MRDIKLIQADISKLQAELEDAKVHVAKRDAAVHILENLGWTHSAKFGWKKPLPKPDVKAREYKAPVVAGAFATYDHKILGGNVFVRSVNASRGTAQVSWVRGVSTAGAFATYGHKILGGNVFVRSVNASRGTAQVSWVRGVSTAGAMIEQTPFAVRIDDLTVKPREYFIGR